MSKKSSIFINTILLLLLPCLSLQQTMRWEGTRHEKTGDGITRLPNHLSCTSVKDINTIGFNNAKVCHCMGGKIFHVFANNSYGCFEPIQVCDTKNCQDLGRATLIGTVSHLLIKFLSKTGQMIDKLLPRKCLNNNIYQATFSKWENNKWENFDENVSITFTLYGTFKNLQVHRNVRSSSGLLRIRIWCPNEGVEPSDYIVHFVQDFVYAAITNPTTTTSMFISSPKATTTATTIATKSKKTTASPLPSTHRSNSSRNAGADGADGADDDGMTDKELIFYIIIPVAGGVVLLILIIIIVCCVVRCRKRKKEIPEAQTNKADDYTPSEYADPSLFLGTNTLRNNEGHEAPVYINTRADERYASIDLKDKPISEYHQLNKENMSTTEPIYFDTETEYYAPGDVMSSGYSNDNEDSLAEHFYHETIKDDYSVTQNTNIDQGTPPLYAPVQKTRNLNNRPKLYVDIEKPDRSRQQQQPVTYAVVNKKGKTQR